MAQFHAVDQPAGPFPGDGEMATRMRAFDWARSSLGPAQHWPLNLRTAVGLCLTSPLPVCIVWGAELAFLYNDAYLPWLGVAMHPGALGQPARRALSDVWDTVGPTLADVAATGRATRSEDTEPFCNRRLPKEEICFTWSLSPILAADGRAVDGIFCHGSEATDQVVGARRLETLRRLAVREATARNVDAACDARHRFRRDLRRGGRRGNGSARRRPHSQPGSPGADRAEDVG